MNSQVTKNSTYIFPRKTPILGAKQKLHYFGRNNFTNLMKYPKIPATLIKHFDQYKATENVVKYIFFYILEHYQVADLDTFLGQKWIEFTPEDIAKKFDLSIEWLMNKTSNHPHNPYQCYQLASLGLDLDESKWSKKDRNLYNSFANEGKAIYNTIFTDALYRMTHQSIPIEASFIEPSIKKQWNMHYYSEGFKILESFKTEFKNGRVIKVKAKLSNKLIQQTHFFFMLIKPSSHKSLIDQSQGHKEGYNLYFYLNAKRNLHFFAKEPKRETTPYRVPFYVLCDKIGLKYKKEPGDIDNWRYKGARKSLTRKLKQIDFISHFEIERVKVKKPLIDVFLFFTKPEENDVQIIDEFRMNREEHSIQVWLSNAYRERLKPGIHPWDGTITTEADIIEKYCNQEYYTQWLANKLLDIDQKKEALKVVFAELYGSESCDQFLIDKKLEEAYQAAKNRIKIEGLTVIKPYLFNKNGMFTTQDTLEKSFARAFKMMYRTDYVYSKLSPSFKKKLETVNIHLRQIYTFFKSEEFPKKELTELIRRVNEVATKTVPSGYASFIWNYINQYLIECQAISYEKINEDLLRLLFSQMVPQAGTFVFNQSMNTLTVLIDLKPLGAIDFDGTMRPVKSLLQSACKNLNIRLQLNCTTIKMVEGYDLVLDPDRPGRKKPINNGNYVPSTVEKILEIS